MANFIPKFTYVHPIDGATTITLTLPPTGDPLKEKISSVGRELRSNAGKTQYQKNYQDQTFELSLIFLSKTLLDELLKLFTDYASFGSTFQYFPSSDEVESFSVIWPGAKKRFQPKKVIASGADFIYDLKINLRVEL